MTGWDTRSRVIDDAIDAAKSAIDDNRLAMIEAPCLGGFTVNVRVGQVVTIDLHAYSDPPRVAGIPPHPTATEGE